MQSFYLVFSKCIRLINNEEEIFIKSQYLSDGIYNILEEKETHHTQIIFGKVRITLYKCFSVLETIFLCI